MHICMPHLIGLMTTFLLSLMLVVYVANKINK